MLLSAAVRGGIVMFAQIAIVRALNEGKEATPVTQRRKRAIS
jgi:hypothetical protein